MACKHLQGTIFEYRKESNTTIEVCMKCSEVVNTYASFEFRKKELSLPQTTDVAVHIEVEENGILGKMFIDQISLQIALGTQNMVLNTKYMTEQCIGICSEVHECLRHIPWKTWKKSQELEIDNLKPEIVDIWQHLINLTIAAGIGTDELYEIFRKNIDKNYRRIREGY